MLAWRLQTKCGSKASVRSASKSARPRGGGSFIAEVDGNYVSWLTAEDGARKFFGLHHPAGKFRGSFEPLAYVVERATCPALLLTPTATPSTTVWAIAPTSGLLERAAADQTEDDDAVLMVMADYPGKSLV